MKEQTREQPEIVAAAEKQMQTWVKTQEIEARAIRSKHEDLAQLTRRLGRYVSLSRETGAGGSEIANLLGRELGWEVLDKSLLDRVANTFHVSRTMLELVDETEGTWVYDVLGAWMDPSIITHEKYVVQLGRVVLAAVRNGNVVLVGRGAQFLLPRETGIAVRVIAPKDFRIKRIVQQRDLGAADARSFVEQSDVGRREFVRRYFHHDIDDPILYDLVINVERLGVDGAVDEILAAVRRG